MFTLIIALFQNVEAFNCGAEPTEPCQEGYKLVCYADGWYCNVDRQYSDCVDSDGGKIYDNYGTTTWTIIETDGEGNESEVKHSYTDRCIIPEPANYIGKSLGVNHVSYAVVDKCEGDDCYIAEYACESAEEPILFNCEHSCQEEWGNGPAACTGERVSDEDVVIPPELEDSMTCTDSDGGIDYYNLGRIHINGLEVTRDGCSDNFNLIEYFCTELGSYSSTEYTCPGICVNGVCIPEDEVDTCIDSDGGKQYFTKGTASEWHSDRGNDIGESFTDFCIKDFSDYTDVMSGTIVAEGFCNDDDEVDVKHVECSDGCLDGVCIGGVIDRENCPTDCQCSDSGIVCSTHKTPNLDCVMGCAINDKCIVQGTRIIIEGRLAYCDISGHFEEQNQDDSTCGNNYECISNFCSNGVCYDIAGELEETQSMVAKIVDFLRSLFGFE